MSKTARLEIRLLDSEKATIEKYAQDQGTTASALLRAGLAAVVHQRPFLTPQDGELLRALREEVRRAGVNLNVLLKTVHLVENGVTETGPNLVDYQTLYAELRAAVDKLTEATKAPQL